MKVRVRSRTGFPSKVRSQREIPDELNTRHVKEEKEEGIIAFHFVDYPGLYLSILILERFNSSIQFIDSPTFNSYRV